jgi:hypothetical protein
MPKVNDAAGWFSESAPNCHALDNSSYSVETLNEVQVFEFVADIWRE